MKTRKRIEWVGAPALFLGLAAGAIAGPTVQLTITSGSAPDGSYGVMGGVYTSPYTGQVGGNGPNIPIICDDFSDEVTPPETWTALATNLADLGAPTTNNVYWNQGGGATQPSGETLQQYNYSVAAYLAEQIVSTTDETQLGYLSFALWEVFDPSAANSLNSTQQGFAHNDLVSAQQAVTAGFANNGLNYLSNFSNVMIYSATTNGVTPETPQQPGRPQEFLAVSMPEPNLPSLLALDLLGVVGLILFLRRRFGSSAN
ncbi:MAG TPA: hypothetical protein VFA85_00305 [Terriglobales bacterium]|nr:hypothetical protein [Terriglobales bacterium]